LLSFLFLSPYQTVNTPSFFFFSRRNGEGEEIVWSEIQELRVLGLIEQTDFSLSVQDDAIYFCLPSTKTITSDPSSSSSFGMVTLTTLSAALGILKKVFVVKLLTSTFESLAVLFPLTLASLGLRLLNRQVHYSLLQNVSVTEGGEVIVPHTGTDGQPQPSLFPLSHLMSLVPVHHLQVEDQEPSFMWSTLRSESAVLAAVENERFRASWARPSQEGATKARLDSALREHLSKRRELAVVASTSMDLSGRDSTHNFSASGTLFPGASSSEEVFGEFQATYLRILRDKEVCLFGLFRGGCSLKN